MNKFIGTLIFTAIFVLLSGCRTSEVNMIRPQKTVTLDGEEKVVAYLTGHNSCYYIFNFLPIWCGNPNRPNTGDYHIFEDNLSELRNEAMLENFANQIGAKKVTNIKHSRTSSGSATLWIVWTHVLKTTGTAVKNNQR